MCLQLAFESIDGQCFSDAHRKPIPKPRTAHVEQIVPSLQGCYISWEICLFPRRQEILGNMGNTGKYKMSNNGLLVGPVVGVLTCWKLIKLGTKTHYMSK